MLPSPDALGRAALFNAHLNFNFPSGVYLCELHSQENQSFHALGLSLVNFLSLK